MLAAAARAVVAAAVLEAAPAVPVPVAKDALAAVARVAQAAAARAVVAVAVLGAGRTVPVAVVKDALAARPTLRTLRNAWFY